MTPHPNLPPPRWRGIYDCAPGCFAIPIWPRIRKRIQVKMERVPAKQEGVHGTHKQCLWTPQEKESVSPEIQATDGQIDRLVYEFCIPPTQICAKGTTLSNC